MAWPSAFKASGIALLLEDGEVARTVLEVPGAHHSVPCTVDLACLWGSLPPFMPLVLSQEV